MSETTQVLIVGVDGENRQELLELLPHIGFKPLLVDTVEEAKTVLAAGSYPLALVGGALPGISVSALVTTLEREISQTGVDVSLVLVDSAQAPIDIEAAVRAGGEDVIALPFVPALVQLKLERALRSQNLLAIEKDKAEREVLAKLEHDVQVGRQIQSSFLPSSLPNPEGWEVAARFHPAREVAGDFYDAFYIWNKRRVVFIVADVSDKGIPAALFMAIFRTLLRAGALYNMSISSGDTLEPVLQPIKEQADWSEEGPDGRRRKLPSIGITQLGSIPSTNAYMAQTHGIDAYFVTVFFGILDPRTGDVIYINGGHNPPVVVRTDGSKTLLKPTGPAVGVIPGAKFRYAHTRLAPGDTLYAYTDGVTDARSPDGEFFGDARLHGLLTAASESAPELVARVDEALGEHMADAIQFDDITMMAVRRLVDGGSTSD